MAGPVTLVLTVDETGVGAVGAEVGMIVPGICKDLFNDQRRPLTRAQRMIVAA